MQVKVAVTKINYYTSLDGNNGSEILITFTEDAGLTFKHSLSRVWYIIPKTQHAMEAEKQAFIKRASKW